VHPDYPFAGASPDGLIDHDGCIEMKCPKSSVVHLQRFVDGLPEEYRPQIQGQLWVTGRQWCDFVSYDPRMPESHRLLKIRVKRDQAYIDHLAECVLEAEQAACALLDRIRRIAA
jgi:hypothetical protein